MSIEEQENLLSEVDGLINYIQLHQLTEPRFDMQRLLMLDGLILFRTRLKHLKWVGASTTFAALKLFLSGAGALEQAKSKQQDVASILQSSATFWGHAKSAFNVASKTYTTGKFFVTAWQELNTALHSQTVQHVIQIAAGEVQKLLPPPH